MREEGLSPITREQAREFDRRAIEEIGVPSLCLMENAGRQLADAACESFGRNAILVLCGTGNNGGDGLVAARHLFLRGIPCEVIVLGAQEKMTSDTRRNYQIALACGISVSIMERLSTADRDKTLAGYGLIIDAMLGTGVSGTVREPYRHAIDVVNRSGVPVLAADIPSGLDCNTGEILGLCVRADRTVTFIQTKTGFEKGEGPAMCGLVSVADIGVPLV